MKILLLSMLLIPTNVFGVEEHKDYEEERQTKKIEQETKQNRKISSQKKN